MTEFTVAALYRFARFDNPEALRAPLLELCTAHGVKGTILLAHEGVNGTIAGEKASIVDIVEHIRTLPDCADLDVKYSHADAMPFYRMKVRIKKEIVTLGVAGIDPNEQAGTYVPPEDWNALISDPDTIVIDTRNDYEVAIGSFKGAINPATANFSDFPAWFRAQKDTLTAAPKIAMFCTGGIRCEKSTAFLKAEGIEQVYHLQGGILRYLETIPQTESLWDGECFVFDQRVSVGHGLEIGTHILCHGCRKPLSEDDIDLPDYVEGVCCASCHDARDDSRRQRYAERHKQVKLAASRGSGHIGVDPRKATAWDKQSDGQ